VSEVREYLIEVPHSPEECSVAQLDSIGDREHLRTYQGCASGAHTTWIIAELAAEEEAWTLVPRLLRDTARVVPVEPTVARAEPLTSGIRHAKRR
jgi:hypothetical protein